MKIYFMSQEYEFAQICSRFVAVYLRLHLKICTLQTRYKKCSVQIDLLFYVFTQLVGSSEQATMCPWKILLMFVLGQLVLDKLKVRTWLNSFFS